MALWKVDGKHVSSVDMYEGRSVGHAVEFRAWHVTGPNKESRAEVECADLDEARKLVSESDDERRLLVYAITRNGSQVLVTKRNLQVWDDMQKEEYREMEEEKREDAIDEQNLAKPEYKALAVLPNGALLKFCTLNDALTHRDVPTDAVVWGRASEFVAHASMEEVSALAEKNLPGTEIIHSPEGKRMIYYALLEQAPVPERRVKQPGSGETEDGDMAGKKGATKKASAKKATKAPKAAGERKPRAVKNADSVIKVLVEENPKRKGSEAHARFAKYKDGMTVDEFLKKGGRTIDLNYDVAHKFISLS
jgi:hypothetical protein